ncbi:hypothetical protein L6164_032540 [Bauhinia variegata]|uniref:Uncharacterized protein n=1 Tax=Bauhinia variegata TaxID=167791 RepID=A0ACB9KNX8_BAUVA|nr:hypothetical protein L6164_032540 [Bauhinia variegata]
MGRLQPVDHTQNRPSVESLAVLISKLPIGLNPDPTALKCSRSLIRNIWYAKPKNEVKEQPVPISNCEILTFAIISQSSSAKDLGVLPSTMADEEVADQKAFLEESCKPKCVKPLLEYQACVKRIQGDESGHKHCTGQYFDYWFCVDKCVAPKLFSKLK